MSQLLGSNRSAYQKCVCFVSCGVDKFDPCFEIILDVLHLELVVCAVNSGFHPVDQYEGTDLRNGMSSDLCCTK
jgi:hypothetical protein